MEMKRALLWYLAILVVMAGGLYLALELFVNNSDSASSGMPEEAAVADAVPANSGMEASAARTDDGISREDIGSGISSDTQSVSGVLSDSPAAAAGRQETPASSIPERSSPADSTASSGESGGNYTVQVAALATREKADGVVDKLKNDGFSSGRIRSDLGDSLYRVWVGSFATKAEAMDMAEKLKGKGYNTYVRAAQ